MLLVAVPPLCSASMAAAVAGALIWPQNLGEGRRYDPETSRSGEYNVLLLRILTLGWMDLRAVDGKFSNQLPHPVRLISLHRFPKTVVESPAVPSFTSKIDTYWPKCPSIWNNSPIPHWLCADLGTSFIILFSLCSCCKISCVGLEERAEFRLDSYFAGGEDL